MNGLIKAVLGIALALGIGFFAFVAALEHPSTRGAKRCFIQETFYEQSGPDAPAGTPVVEAAVLTDPVRDQCDAADDPAIWVDEAGAVVVLGTNKQRSLNAYGADGALLFRADEIGAPNNVDIREAFGMILALASEKDASEIEVFALNPRNGVLSAVPGAPLPARAETELYGICAYRHEDRLYAFTTDKSGLVVQYVIERFEESGAFTAREMRELRVETQPEGCVVDDANNTLFVGEEDVGIWRFDARPEASTQGKLIARTGAKGALTADVEGLAIYQGDGDESGYLIASSQGDNTYAVFDRAAPHAFKGRFQVQYEGRLIGDTDGLDVTSTPVGARFPKGMLVVQDGFVRSGGRKGVEEQSGERRYQRFAYVPWHAIEEALEL